MARRVIVFGIDGLVLPLVEHFVRQGRLAHFARLWREGAVAKALPFVSTWGAINWMCFATGASPGTAWQGEGRALIPGLSTAHAVEEGRTQVYGAETLWEALERQGRSSVLLSFPGAWPPNVRRGYVGVPDPVDARPSIALARPARYMTAGLAEKYRQPPGTRAGWVPLAQRAAQRGAVPVLATPSAPTEWRNLPQGEFMATVVLVRGVGGQMLAEFGLLLPRALGSGRPILLCDGKDVARVVARLRPGAWSEWVRLAFGPTGREGLVRFKLLEVSDEGREVAICHSEVYPATGFLYPGEAEQGVLDRIGPYASGSSANPHPSDPFWRTAVEEAAYEGRWLVSVARRLAALDDWALFLTVFRPVDAANHGCLAFADPDSRHYGGPLTPIAMDILAEIYGVADEVLGGMMQMADGETVVAIASDHGATVNQVMCDIYHLLIEHGLLAVTDADGVPTVDWSRTRAYIRPTRSGSEVFINLVGREPHGIVGPEEYEALQERIIDLLLGWREPETGKRAVALALKKKDAALLGYWGRPAGDVQFIYNSGFVWGELASGQTIARTDVPSANHGPQIPTTETTLSSNMGLFALWGAGVRSGYRRPVDVLGPVRMCDPAPTIAHLLGIAPPRHNEGAVLRDMLDIM